MLLFIGTTLGKKKFNTYRKTLVGNIHNLKALKDNTAHSLIARTDGTIYPNTQFTCIS
jgi:hypothetical protein